MKKVLIVTAATGAGHNSVANSVSAALRQLGTGLLEADILDWRALGGLSWTGQTSRLYACTIVHFPILWGLVYRLSDTSTFCRVFRRLMRKTWRCRTGHMLRTHAPDLVICVHPLSTQVVAEALRETGSSAPLATVVTDLAVAHATWIAPQVSLYLVPTEEVRMSLIARGVNSQQIRLIGLPIGARFWAGEPDSGETRRQLGLAEEAFTVLLAGGGEGAGAMLSAAEAISKARLPVQLIIACGRNGRLRRKLDRRSLSVANRVLGFGDNMPKVMKAADVVVSKAGALTTGEAIATGRPIVYLRPLPGQETTNARFACSHGLAHMVSSPSELVRTMERWLADPSEMRQLVAGAEDYRKHWTHAATRIAVVAMEMLGLAENGRPSTGDCQR